MIIYADVNTVSSAVFKDSQVNNKRLKWMFGALVQCDDVLQ